MTAPAPGTLLAQIGAWCDEHPSIGRHRSYSALALRRHADGSISIEGEPPDVIALGMPLLAEANLRYVSFADGVLTIDTPPTPLRYRALGPAQFDFAIVFERIKEART